MGTSRQTMDFLLDQLDRALPITTRKMFGEYCVYWDGKPVAFVCDDQLFVKPTEAGRAMQNPVVVGAPYPGAKMYLLVGADLWEDREWLGELLRVTAEDIPETNRRMRRRQIEQCDKELFGGINTVIVAHTEGSVLGAFFTPQIMASTLSELLLAASIRLVNRHLWIVI